MLLIHFIVLLQHAAAMDAGKKSVKDHSDTNTLTPAMSHAVAIVQDVYKSEGTGAAMVKWDNLQWETQNYGDSVLKQWFGVDLKAGLDRRSCKSGFESGLTTTYHDTQADLVSLVKTWQNVLEANPPDYVGGKVPPYPLPSGHTVPFHRTADNLSWKLNTFPEAIVNDELAEPTNYVQKAARSIEAMKILRPMLASLIKLIKQASTDKAHKKRMTMASEKWVDREDWDGGRSGKPPCTEQHGAKGINDGDFQFAFKYGCKDGMAIGTREFEQVVYKMISELEDKCDAFTQEYRELRRDKEASKGILGPLRHPMKWSRAILPSRGARLDQLFKNKAAYELAKDVFWSIKSAVYTFGFASDKSKLKAKCDRALAQTKSKTKFGAGDTLKQALLPGNTKANTDCQPIGSSLVTCKQCLNSATNKPGIAPACVFDKNQYKCIANHLHEMFDDFEFATKTEDCPTVFKLNDKMYRDSQTTEKKNS